MTLQSIAHAYTTCVELEEKAAMESPELADDLAVLRSDLHALLMEGLRESKISFVDRADAARLAFQMAEKPPHQSVG